MRIYKTRADFTKLQAAQNPGIFAGTVCTITDEALNPMYVFQGGVWNSTVTATTDPVTGGIKLSAGGVSESLDQIEGKLATPIGDLVPATSAVTQVPLSIGVDGWVYGSQALWSKQLVRSADGFASVDAGPTLDAAGNRTVIYVTRTAEGYVAVTALESYPGAPGSNTAWSATSEIWFSTDWLTGWSKVKDIGHSALLAISQPVWSAKHGGTILLVGEYSNTAGQEHTLWRTADGGATWAAVFKNGANGVNAIDDVGSSSHIHGSCYDVSTDRIFVSCGDAGNSWFGYSTDDGATWTPSLAASIPTNNAFGYHQPVLVHSARAGIVTTPDGSAGYAGIWMLDKRGCVELAAIELGAILPADQFGQAPVAHADDEIYVLCPMTGARSSNAFYIVGSADGGRSWHQVYTAAQGATEYFDRGIIGPDINGKLYAHKRTWDGTGNPATASLITFTRPSWLMASPTSTVSSGASSEVSAILRALGALRSTAKLSLKTNGGSIDAGSLMVTGNNAVTYWGSTTAGSQHTWDTPATGAVAIRQKVNGYNLCQWTADTTYGQLEFNGALTYIKFTGVNGGMIATQTTQKMGFWGATPVVKPTGTPAAATDLATALTLVNDLRTKLMTIGLIA